MSQKIEEDNIIKKIVIATDFTDTPGARERKDSKFSGQEFFEDYLKPALEEATKKDKKVFIDLDGACGYPSSFISSAFGKLSDAFGKNIIDFLELKSEENGRVIRRIKEAIEEGNS